jgi:hypothetical protein
MLLLTLVNIGFTVYMLKNGFLNVIFSGSNLLPFQSLDKVGQVQAPWTKNTDPLWNPGAAQQDGAAYPWRQSAGRDNEEHFRYEQKGGVPGLRDRTVRNLTRSLQIKELLPEDSMNYLRLPANGVYGENLLVFGMTPIRLQGNESIRTLRFLVFLDYPTRSAASCMQICAKPLGICKSLCTCTR